MSKSFLMSTVAGLALLGAGLGFASPQNVEKSEAGKPSCCVTQEACCGTETACCDTTTADNECCAPGAACCFEGSPCCE